MMIRGMEMLYPNIETLKYETHISFNCNDHVCITHSHSHFHSPLPTPPSSNSPALSTPSEKVSYQFDPQRTRLDIG